MNKNVEQIKRKILPILKKRGVVRSSLFGSVVKGNVGKKSDVDILVKIKKPIGLFEFVGLKHELEDELGKKVDLVEYDTIKPRIRERILSEQIRIL